MCVCVVCVCVWVCVCVCVCVFVCVVSPCACSPPSLSAHDQSALWSFPSLPFPSQVIGVHTFSIANKVTRLARMPQTMRLIRSIKLLSEEAEKTNRKNILLATYNLVKARGHSPPCATAAVCCFCFKYF